RIASRLRPVRHRPAPPRVVSSFFLNAPPPTELYTLSPTRRSSDLPTPSATAPPPRPPPSRVRTRSPTRPPRPPSSSATSPSPSRSEEHTSELQSRENLVCRLLLEKKKKQRPKAHRPPESYTQGCTH